MAISAALLDDDVLQGYPIRQWVLSLPIPLKMLLARYPSELSKVMSITHRAISTHVDDDDSLLQLQGASLSYRIAMGPQQGQKVFTLQTLPASTEGEYEQLANTSGFSLHAGASANADEHERLERLCRYISRPAISEQRLSITKHGKVRYELKMRYRNCTTIAPIFEFIPYQKMKVKILRGNC
jgi:hypothetical protein